MAKGDDAVRRKKNKAQRKKLNRKSDSSTVSARVASIIAAKKRRKAGKRRICQDILETSGSSSDFEQIAWIASTAADVISRREKEGHLFTGPFLLFIVPSKEKALKVRSLCKPLKAQGIHTVSLHPGASIDHQINGLQSCEPEFLVSTPERLLELVSLKATDISGVSMLVIDGMESASGGCYLDTVKSVRQSISGKPHTLVFFNSFNNAYVPAVQSLLTGLVYRLSLNDSVASQSAGIIQSIHVCSSKEERTMKVPQPSCLSGTLQSSPTDEDLKALKYKKVNASYCLFGSAVYVVGTERIAPLNGLLISGIQALDNAYSNQIIAQHLKVLYVVGKDNNIQKLVSAVKFKGYSISISSYLNSMESGNSLDCGGRMRPTVSIIDTENISCTDLGEYGVVIIPDFVLSIDDYLQILTRMARHTVNGVLHSFLTKDDSQHAGPLIEILEQCGQEVAEELRNFFANAALVLTICKISRPCGHKEA
ncbi:hypothetical protein GOBAR_DD32296 [Gossypium barbadense]|nr:hypothetical protein GOBAR_DD32296 [Gossypium barbadense]